MIFSWMSPKGKVAVLTVPVATWTNQDGTWGDGFSLSVTWAGVGDALSGVASGVMG